MTMSIFEVPKRFESERKLWAVVGESGIAMSIAASHTVARLGIFAKSDSEPEMVSIFLACGNGLGFSGSQTLSAIIGNGAVDNGAAIDAFPCVEHQEEV